MCRFRGTVSRRWAPWHDPDRSSPRARPTPAPWCPAALGSSIAILWRAIRVRGSDQAVAMLPALGLLQNLGVSGSCPLRRASIQPRRSWIPVLSMSTSRPSHERLELLDRRLEVAGERRATPRLSRMPPSSGGFATASSQVPRRARHGLRARRAASHVQGLDDRSLPWVPAEPLQLIDSQSIWPCRRIPRSPSPLTAMARASA